MALPPNLFVFPILSYPSQKQNPEKKIFKFRFVGLLFRRVVGAAIGRPPNNCTAIVGISVGNNRLSPCGDQILLHKIWRATNGRPYKHE